MRGTQLLDSKALRCSSCGAPLKDPGSGDLVKCDHCGTVQKLVDARAFLDQIMLQVNAFVRQALPVGIDAAQSSTIDPVARHNLWVTSVGPRLASEYSEYRFQAYNLFSHPLAALPFTITPGSVSSGGSKEAFLFQAKVQGISSLAVDDESKATVAEATGLAVAYAYALNNVGLLQGDKPERYHLLDQNFADAAKALRDVPKLQALAFRFEGLSTLSRGLDHLASARVNDARPLLQQAGTTLGQARQLISTDFDLSVMLQAVDEETSLSRAAGHMAEALSLDPGGLSARSLLSFQAMMGVMARTRASAPALLQRTFAAQDRQEKIMRMTLDARRAQAGQSYLRVAPTQGPLALPFWVVEAPYSFQTGAAWRKHAVEVAEAILLSATFPLDASALSLTDTSGVLTDVFSARERSGLLARMGGRETAVSGGGPVRALIQASGPRPLQGCRVVPPLSTAEDAAIVVQSYIEQSRRADPTLDRQLKLSSPRVTDLVYVPLQPPPPGYPAIPPLAALSPRSVGDGPTLAAIAL
jgi:hypothetical protein